MSSREQAAVTQATRLPREMRCTFASPLKLRARNAPLERGRNALSALTRRWARLAHRTLIFLSGGQCVAQECSGIIESEQIRYSAPPHCGTQQRAINQTADRARPHCGGASGGVVSSASDDKVGGYPARARSEERRVGKECRSRWSV